MIIGIDLDGTIAQYGEWKGEEVIGDPIDGAREFLEALKNKGHTLIIFTARASTPVGRQAVIRWARQHKLWHLFDDVTNKKEYKFWRFVDDRAIHFNGDNYNEVLQLLSRDIE